MELAVFNLYQCIHHDLHVVFGEMQNFIFLADLFVADCGMKKFDTGTRFHQRLQRGLNSLAVLGVSLAGRLWLRH